MQEYVSASEKDLPVQCDTMIKVLGKTWHLIAPQSVKREIRNHQTFQFILSRIYHSMTFFRVDEKDIK